ncbi:MAG TPA: phage head closure protein [Cellvibrionaceae bacterium]
MNSTYRAGQLNKRITVQRQVLTDDGAGGKTNQWVAVRNCWAYRRQLSAKESVQADQLKASSTWIFVIRNHPQKIKETDSLIYGQERYNIRGISPQDVDCPFIEITAEAGVA